MGDSAHLATAEAKQADSTLDTPRSVRSAGSLAEASSSDGSSWTNLGRKTPAHSRVA